MKIIAVKTLDGRVLETFKRPIKWKRDAWLDVTICPGLPPAEVILVGANGEQKRVPYQERDTPPLSYYEKKVRERREWQRVTKLSLAFITVILLARLAAGYGPSLAFLYALVVAIAFHLSYEIKDLRDRIEELKKSIEEKGRIPDVIEQPEPYLRPPLSFEEYEDFERVERGRESRRPVWPRIIDWIFH